MIVTEFVGSANPAQVNDQVVCSAVRLLRGRRAALFRVDAASGISVCVAVAGDGDSGRWLGRTLAERDGAVGRMIGEERSVSASDPRVDPRRLLPDWFHDCCRAEGLGAAIAAPLEADGDSVGTLLLADAAGRVFTDDDRGALAAFIDLASLALVHTRAREDGESRLRVTEALLDIARTTSSTLDLKQVLKIVARRTAQAVGAMRCSINLFRDEQLVPVMSQFADGHSDPALWQKFKTLGLHRLEQVPANAEAIRTRRPVVIDDALNSELIAPSWRDAWGVRAALVVPMVRQDEVVGTLNLDRTDGPHPWSRAQIDFAMTIANHAALAAENARLYEQVSGQLRELRQTQDQLLQAGKLAAIGQLVAGVAHEVNNPLAVIVGQAQLLRLRTADPHLIDKLGQILKSALRAAGIIKQLQTFARPRPAQLAPVRLTKVIERVLGLREQTLRVSGIRVLKDIAPVVPRVWGDEQQLDQVLLNLLLNAEQALARDTDQRELTVRLRAREGTVQLAISDTGPGVDPDVLPRIFEPFFTTKPVGQGTGLGLSICYGIVSAHGGRIWAESQPGQGATFVVQLPAWEGEEVVADAPLPPSPASDCRPGRALIVDDEEYVADTLRGLLEYLRQDVKVAGGGLAGLEELTRPGACYDIVTVDMKMPDLSGTKLWERLVAERSPFADRVVFITGDTVDPETQSFLERAGRPVMSKPVGIEDLAAVLRYQQSGR